MKVGADAPQLQLDLFEDLKVFEVFFPNLAQVVIHRMQSNHLWYASVLALALTSKLVADSEKQKIVEALLAAPSDKLEKGAIKMPLLVSGCTLASRINAQSHHFFQALGIGTGWLSEPISTWPEIPGYQKLFKFAHNLPLIQQRSELSSVPMIFQTM